MIRKVKEFMGHWMNDLDSFHLRYNEHYGIIKNVVSQFVDTPKEKKDMPLNFCSFGTFKEDLINLVVGYILPSHEFQEAGIGTMRYFRDLVLHEITGSVFFGWPTLFRPNDLEWFHYHSLLYYIPAVFVVRVTSDPMGKKHPDGEISETPYCTEHRNGLFFHYFYCTPRAVFLPE